jgi:hypothetical protein
MSLSTVNYYFAETTVSIPLVHESLRVIVYFDSHAHDIQKGLRVPFMIVAVLLFYVLYRWDTKITDQNNDAMAVLENIEHDARKQEYRAKNMASRQEVNASKRKQLNNMSKQTAHIAKNIIHQPDKSKKSR